MDYLEKKKRGDIDKSAIVVAQSQAFLPGTPVWAPCPQNKSTWLRGIVEGVSRGADESVTLSIKLEDGEISKQRASDCFLQNEKDDTVDDLVHSDFLHEPGILHTLRVRYELDMIYTYSGQILIAVNPHKPLKHLYGERMMEQYKGTVLGDLSPHTYAVAEAAYAAMMIDENRQAILISGESGAGKTESAKMVMQYLAHRSGTQSGLNGRAAPIEQQILESNPLLEAFGNAKTMRNDNSSRFGKFVEIDFDPTGKVTGASISTYLLERSRVVNISSPERSFHIFYQIVYGSSDDLKERLHLSNDADYFDYLAQSKTFTLDTIDDKEGFIKTLNAMKIIGLDGQQILDVLNCVAAVLHLGNIKFETDDKATADEAVISSDPKSIRGLEVASSLLGTSPKELENALMRRAIVIAGERIEKRFNVLESTESRDSLAKSLYSRLFDWLVSAINKKIGSVGGSERTPLTIGILDIYGFESFDNNSFEQLCINLANEKLQQSFNSHVFKAEQDEYASEGIEWSYIEFIDNQDVLDLLEGTELSDVTSNHLVGKHIGIFPMIDEACRLPRATSHDLAISLRTKLASHPRFSAPKRDQYSFTVNHYAGEVRYSTDSFLEKNRDFIVEDQESLMRKCRHHLPRDLYTKDELSQKTKSSFKLNTIGASFQKQLHALSTTLAECQPHFIRCIKPNEAAKPGNLNPAYAMEQLRAGGVLEAVRIACAGYPTRKPILPFAQRYSLLLTRQNLLSHSIPITERGFVDWNALTDDNKKLLVNMLMKKSKLTGWQLGKTRIFLRTGQLAALEGLRGRALMESVIIIQSSWRKFIARRNFMTTINAVILIQSVWKSYSARVSMLEMRRINAATTIQAYYRSCIARREFIEFWKVKNAVIIQTSWRMVLARRHFVKQSRYLQELQLERLLEQKRNDAATTIQSNWRKILDTRRVKAISFTMQQMKDLERQNQVLEREAEISRKANALLQANLDIAQRIASSQEIQIQSLQSEVDTFKRNSSGEYAAKDSVGEVASSYEISSSLKEEIAILTKSYENSRAAEIKHEEMVNSLEIEVSQWKSEVSNCKGIIKSLRAEASARELELDDLVSSHKSYDEKIFGLEAKIISLEEELLKMRTLLEKKTKEMSVLQDELKEKDGQILTQENENAILSSRIESLRQQIENHNIEKASTSLQLAQLKEKINEFGSTSIGSDVTVGKSVTVGDLSKTTSLDVEQAYGDAILLKTLDIKKSSVVDLLITTFIMQKSILVDIQSSISPCKVRLPYGSWVIRNCINYWAETWTSGEVMLAIKSIADGLSLESAKNLASCLHCLNLICSTSAMVKVEAVGRKNSALYISASQDLIGCVAVYERLGALISSNLSIHAPSLLSEDARRSTRHHSLQKEGRSLETRLNVMGSSKVGWKNLIGSLSNLAVTLQEENLPLPLAKAVVWATMRYIDGSLVNGILLRRDLCSVSSAKALHTGLEILEIHMTTGDLAFTPHECRDAFQRSLQVAQFLTEGFEDCKRKARAGVNICGHLKKFEALTLEQIYRLSEMQHDNWLPTAVQGGIDRKILLETLRTIKAHPAEFISNTGTTEGTTPTKQWVVFDASNTDELVESPEVTAQEDLEDLLVDPLAAFYLYAKGYTRKQITINSKMYFCQSEESETLDFGQSSVFSKIDQACKKVPIPPALLSCTDLHFISNTL
jgi:myosin-5